MGGGVSRINSAPHTSQFAEPNEFGLSPRTQPSNVKTNKPTGRRRIFSDPLVIFSSGDNSVGSANQALLTPLAKGAKLIFSPLLSPPSEPAQKKTKQPGDDSTVIATSEFSARKAEKKYWKDVNANFRDHSWNEIQISALLAKPFTGQVRKVSPMKKNKLKNVRTVAVTRVEAN